MDSSGVADPNQRLIICKSETDFSRRLRPITVITTQSGQQVVFRSGIWAIVTCVWKCQRIGLDWIRLDWTTILACSRICDDKHDTLPADDLQPCQPCHLFARHSDSDMEEQPDGSLAAWQPISLATKCSSSRNRQFSGCQTKFEGLSNCWQKYHKDIPY